MNKKEIKGIGQVVDIYKLENGLTVYFVKLENRNNYYIEYVVKFGANVVGFRSKNDKEYKNVVKGTAHFLEHKMFEQEEGVDPFTFFSRYGTDSNASTGYKKTDYILDGIFSIEDNLEFLLNYVNSPYFTDENVEKEKNIIIQELKMYLDDPETKMTNECYNLIFKNHPMKTDIGGTVDSVKTITKEDLYNCYNAFYNPSNMFLVIGGDVNIKSVMDVIENNDALKKNNKLFDAEIKDVRETLKINKKKKIITIDKIYMPKLAFMLKLPLDETSIDEKYKYVSSCSVLMDMLFGDESSFFEDSLLKGLITDFYFYKTIADKFLIFEFYAEGEKLEDLTEEMYKTFKNTKLEKDTLERCKKGMLSQIVLRYDRVVESVSSITGEIINYGDIVYNKVDIIKEINLNYIEELRKKIDFNNSSYVIALPKNK